MVSVVVLRVLGLVTEPGLQIEVEYHHFLVEGGEVVDRNDLGLPNLVLGEFDHIHSKIDSIDLIVKSHEASVLVGPDISFIQYPVLTRREASREATYRIRSHPPPISHWRSNIITSPSLLLLAENRKRFPRSIRRR